MMLFTIFVFGTIFGTTLPRLIQTDDDDTDVNYNFKYGVEDITTGDIKSHQEVRNGKEVSGVYTLREADGTTRIVKYTAGPETGFNAVVETVGTTVDSTVQSYGDFSGQGFHFPGHQTAAGETEPSSTQSTYFQSIKLGK